MIKKLTLYLNIVCLSALIPFPAYSEVINYLNYLPKYKLPKPPPESFHVKFKLRELRIEGTSLYTPHDFFYLYQKMINQEVLLADIHKIAYKITVKYQKERLKNARAFVPIQRIDKGVVCITVIESYIDHGFLELPYCKK